MKYQIQDPIVLHVYEMNILNAKAGENFELKDQLWQLSQAITDQDIQTFNFKQICSLDQYCRHAIFDE